MEYQDTNIQVHTYFGRSWYGSTFCIYNYLCNQCLSPLPLRIRIQFRPGQLDTTLCDKVCLTCEKVGGFSPGNLVSSTNKLTATI